MKSRKILITAALFALSGCGDDGQSGEPGTIAVTLEVGSLPTAVPYNNSAHAIGMEYQWAVTFDTDGNGGPSAGDLRLSMQHYKFDGQTETTAPLADMDASLWVYINGTTVRRELPIRKAIEGNLITLSVDRAAHPGLDAIGETSGVNFQTEYYDPSGTSRDYFPAPLHSTTPGTSRFVVLSPDGRTTDAQGDALWLWRISECFQFNFGANPCCPQS